MHKFVRDLYKRFLLVARDWPEPEVVKQRAKEAFFKNRHLTREDDIKMAVHRGRQVVRELQGVIQFKKYRTMRHRYYGGFAPEQPADDANAKSSEGTSSGQ